MERLPVPHSEKDIRAPIMYWARSIAAMDEGRRVAITDRKREITEWRQGLRGINKITKLPIFLQTAGMLESPIVTSVVRLPTVRHFPQQDNPKHSNTITVFDQTGEIEVDLPQREELRLTQALEKETETRLNPQLLRERSWASPIILAVGYNEEGQNRYHLVFVTNSLVLQPDRISVDLSLHHRR